MKYIQRTGITCLLIAFAINASAQERDFDKEFETFTSQIEDEYQSFNDKINKEFAEFLKQTWEEFLQEAPQPVEERPEPVEPVTYKPLPEDIPRVEITPAGIFTYVSPIKETPAIPIKTPDKKYIPRVVVPFYETDIEVAVGFAGGLELVGLEERQVAAAWTFLCEGDYIQLVQDCMEAKEKYQMNDWAYVDFAKQIALRLYSEEKPNEVSILQMFILLQSGYKAKIAKIGDQLTLMFATTTTVYGAPHITIDGINYYICEHLGERASKGIFTYRNEFANAKNLIDLHFNMPLNLDSDIYESRLSNKESEVIVESEVNKHLIEFYKNYPQCDMTVYSRAPISLELASSILPAFREAIKGKSKKDAVAFLLDFVQTAFEYKTDRDQFGYEKPFFLEETFFYPYCDCEDRAILFTYLVKELTGLDAVLLNYPKHMASAVRFDENLKGDGVNIRGERYVICDPTFIGAPIGSCMPEFVTVSPKVIR